MAETANSDDLTALRERIAQLEAKHPKLNDVENRDLIGIHQLSHAIETQQLDRFVLRNSVPDKVFWGWFWAFIFIAAAVVAYSLIRY